MSNQGIDIAALKAAALEVQSAHGTKDALMLVPAETMLALLERMERAGSEVERITEALHEAEAEVEFLERGEA